MPIDINQALGIHAQALQLRAQRMELLANNLANADTPQYKARDIDFSATFARALSEQGGAANLQTTQAGHIASGVDAASGGAELLYRVPHQPSLDGNTVDTQIEQSEFAQNALHYQASLTFLSGRIRSLMAALRGD